MTTDDKPIVKPGQVIDPDKLPAGHPYRTLIFGDYLDDSVFDKDDDETNENK